MKVGLMGGTFDPPHKAHLEMAKKAAEEYSLAKIIFMTGGNPPHKTSGTDGRLRSHMVRLAVNGSKVFEVSDYEINKEGYSYTADTLCYLNNEYPDDTFYFIIGGDSFRAIMSWYKPEEILSRCVLLVYPRDGYPGEADVKKFNEKYGSDVRILHADAFDISSTQIREMIKNSDVCPEFLEPEVYRYIKRNSLYIPHLEGFEEHLKRLLKTSRYEHSLGVAGAAVAMAGIFGVDVKKAYIAGLLHDCAKNLTPEETRQKCIDFDVELDEFELENPGLVHAKLGAEFVKAEFGINDREICEAIKWHTLGRPGMGTLEKIIFIADMIERTRDYPEVNYLREFAYSDLDRALFECVSATVKFNEEKGKAVHPNAYKVLDWLKK